MSAEMAPMVEELEGRLHAGSLSRGEYYVQRQRLEREGEAQQRRQQQEDLHVTVQLTS